MDSQEEEEPKSYLPPPGWNKTHGLPNPHQQVQQTDGLDVYTPQKPRIQIKQPISAGATVTIKNNPHIKLRPNDGPMGFGYYKESDEEPGVINYYPVSGVAKHLHASRHTPRLSHGFNEPHRHAPRASSARPELRPFIAEPGSGNLLEWPVENDPWAFNDLNDDPVPMPPRHMQAPSQMARPSGGFSGPRGPVPQPYIAEPGSGSLLGWASENDPWAFGDSNENGGRLLPQPVRAPLPMAPRNAGMGRPSGSGFALYIAEPGSDTLLKWANEDDPWGFN